MKNDSKYLKHIIESITNIERFMLGLSKKEFLVNIEKQYAVVRGIEIIGEAVKNVSPLLKKKYPLITWRDIAGTRDILIHSYFSVDLDLVWDIVQRDLPTLREVIEKILKEESK